MGSDHQSGRRGIDCVMGIKVILCVVGIWVSANLGSGRYLTVGKDIENLHDSLDHKTDAVIDHGLKEVGRNVRHEEQGRQRGKRESNEEHVLSTYGHEHQGNGHHHHGEDNNHDQGHGEIGHVHIYDSLGHHHNKRDSPQDRKHGYEYVNRDGDHYIQQSGHPRVHYDHKFENMKQLRRKREETEKPDHDHDHTQAHDY